MRQRLLAQKRPQQKVTIARQELQAFIAHAAEGGLDVTKHNRKGNAHCGNQPFNVASTCVHTTHFVNESSAGVEGGPAAVVSSKNEPNRSRYGRDLNT